MLVRVIHADFPGRFQTGLEGVLLGSAAVLDNAIDFFRLCRIIPRHGDGFLADIEKSNPAQQKMCKTRVTHRLHIPLYIDFLYIVKDFPGIFLKNVGNYNVNVQKQRMLCNFNVFSAIIK